MMEVMEEEAQELLSHFSHRNLDALLRLTRNTLEALRRRIHASSLMHFLGQQSHFLSILVNIRKLYHWNCIIQSNISQLTNLIVYKKF